MAAVPEAVRLLRKQVLDWLRDSGVSDRGLAASVGLAATEAVSNAVRHAYGAEPGRVELSAQLERDAVLLRVSDQGQGLSADADTQTGLGMPVISRVANGVTVASDADGTTVSMRFALAHPRPDRFGFRTRLRYRPMLGV